MEQTKQLGWATGHPAPIEAASMFPGSSAVTAFAMAVSLAPLLSLGQNVPPTTMAHRKSEYETCRNLAADGPSLMLATACDFALSTEKQYPNFICDEITERYEGPGKRKADVITATVTFIDGAESYTNIAIDGKLTRAGPLHVGGMSSSGHFITSLRNVFHSDSKARFSFEGEMIIEGRHAYVFKFDIDSKNSQWLIETPVRAILPAYHGRLSIGESPTQFLHLEQEPELAGDFPYRKLNLTTEYAPVDFGERGSFLMPTRSTMIACKDHSDASCLRNETRFEHCRKFTGKARVIPDASDR